MRFLRRLFSLGGWALLALYFLVGLTIVIGRLWLPVWLTEQREWLAAEVSARLGLPVTIGAIEASWPGLNPRLLLRQVAIHDQAQREALRFERIDAELSLRSLFAAEPVFAQIGLFAPALEIRRQPDGRLLVAGLPVSEASEPGMLSWLLRQGRIRVEGARIAWFDEMRGAPALVLSEVDGELQNFFGRHRFALRARPPAEAAERFELRADWRGDAAPLAEKGRLYVELLAADLALWRQWADLPFGLASGRGSVRLWLEGAANEASAVADLALADLSLQAAPELPELLVERLSGRIVVERENDRLAARVLSVDLIGRDGVRLEGFSGEGEFVPAGRKAGGKLVVARLDLGAVTRLARHLPLPANVAEALTRFSPAGRLAHFELAWTGTPETIERWRIRGDFAALALSAWREFPGFAGVSGHIDGTETEGRFAVHGAATLVLPAVFPEPTVELANLVAEGGWKKSGEIIEFRLARAAFANAEAMGEAHGRYRFTGGGLGEIDLAARLEKASGQAVWRYLPFVVSSDARAWLKRAIVGGYARQVTLRLKGPLDRFPFRDGKSGVFQVKGQIVAARLDYAPDWPMISAIDGELSFDGPRMLIQAQRAELAGVRLAHVVAEIPDLEAASEMLHITGQARGKTQAFLDFLEKSPVGGYIDHFTRDFLAKGEAALELRLVMPLRDLDKTQVDGRLRFSDNVLQVSPDVPELTAVGGELRFTGEALTGKNLKARLWGMPLSIDLSSRGGGKVRLAVEGRLAASALGAWGGPLAAHFSGETLWRGQAVASAKGIEFSLGSDLDGLASSLPEPFNKTTVAKRRFSLVGRLSSEETEVRGELEGAASGRWLKDRNGARAALAVGRQAKLPTLPESGIAAVFAEREIDADRWRTLLGGKLDGNDGAPTGEIVRLELSAARLTLFERDFHDARIVLRKAAPRWRIDVASREALGQLTWHASGAGRLSGRLQRLHWPASKEGAAPQDDDGREPPALALVVDDFRLGGRALGTLELNAETADDVWHWRLHLRNEAARLKATGAWRLRRGQPLTEGEFELTVEDGEKLLTLLALPDALKGGRGALIGRLAWPGSPFSWQPERVSGELSVDLERGQFKKLEPGVGRLLGVLSLQALPRRIALDFRDVFSEGFAFDRMSGRATIERGKLQSNDFEIVGPAARISLTGNIDLAAETQDLRVRVQPALGETVATGALLINPAVGAATWLAQKILKDPLGQVFAYEYAITGGWNDPQVARLGAAPSPSSLSPSP